VTIEELKTDLRLILNEEQKEQIDWQTVDAHCDEVLRRLNTEPEPDYPYDIVYHFLDDADVRRKSHKYADAQRQRLREWLQSQ
jgi:hypothetical protein